MIATLTLNPAIDKTLNIDGFAPDAVNRVKKVTVDAGGKGVNASRIINSLGGDTVALGFLGGMSGHEHAAMLDAEGIRHDFTQTAGITRTNIKIVDEASHTCTDINEAGPHVSPDELAELKTKLRLYAQKSEIMIFSGSVPGSGSVPVTVYHDMILELKALGAKIMLDTSGGLLKEGIKAVPWLIKPNLAEFSELTGRNLSDTGGILRECETFIRMGIKYVCVTLGGGGLILASCEKAVLAKPPRVTALSTVGAGDACAGSLAVSLMRNETLAEDAKLACAVSAASVTLGHTGAPSDELIRDIYDCTEVIFL